MSKVKFTEGEWKVHLVGSQFAVGPLSKTDDQSFGMMNVVAWIEKFDFYSERQSEANANLISKAPDMYNMLQTASDILKQVNGCAEHHTAKEIDDLIEIIKG